MPSTVTAAFNLFMTTRVNLDSVDTATARSSRGWLLSQIHQLPGRYSDFPRLYSDVDIHYGSFARRTKIRELDDLDVIVGLKGQGTTYVEYSDAIRLSVPDGIPLRELCHDGSSLLNSRRVINRFVKHLSDVPQYEQADIKRNESAAVLKLKSYLWTFDIVPGFITNPELDGRTYYIIPDGNGHWKKTDPRIDDERLRALNQAHGGNVLRAIRLMKYWNNRSTMPTMSSYLFECTLLKYYESALTQASAYVDIEATRLLPYLVSAVLGAVQDPKRIQGDLNGLSWDERIAISARASVDADKARRARDLEEKGAHRDSIRLWGEIFGPNFPAYS